jgi:hypothetical protein
MDDLLQCIQLADVLKPAKAAGDELLQIIGKKDKYVTQKALCFNIRSIA